MSDLMQFQETWEEWEEFEASYGFTDSEEVYTNGARLIPSFRVEQWLEHINSAKYDVWIPCSERLPEEDVEVLITYRYKDGEGDTSHAYIDITTYGQMYFGGNKVGAHKHWRAPFEYFESNYEVIAWMPLPESYKEEYDE